MIRHLRKLQNHENRNYFSDPGALYNVAGGDGVTLNEFRMNR